MEQRQEGDENISHGLHTGGMNLKRQKTQQRGRSRSNVFQKLQEGQSGINRMKGENKKLSQRQGPD